MSTSRRPGTDAVVRLLSDLVAVNSINPSLVPGGSGEREIGDYIAGRLRKAGLRVETPEVAPGRPNVIARLPGHGGGRSLILNAHVDTVGVEAMEAPFQPRVEGDRLYGRGAFDMKSGLAAVMLAAEALAEGSGLRGDVIVTAVADEEYASLGTEAVVRSLRADAAIVTEPTGLRLCTAHRGFAWLSVETEGRAAHGSRPDLGVDAISHMGRILIDLENLSSQLAAGPKHPLLGTGSLHASRISGGQELSSYPMQCRLDVERRTIPGETPDSVLTEVQEIIARRAGEDPSLSARANLFFWRDPFEVSETEEIVAAVNESATDVIGRPPEVYGEAWWMDSALLSPAGIPTVVFGPAGEGAHSTQEWASISSVATCAEVLIEAATRFCNGAVRFSPSPSMGEGAGG